MRTIPAFQHNVKKPKPKYNPITGEKIGAITRKYDTHSVTLGKSIDKTKGKGWFCIIIRSDTGSVGYGFHKISRINAYRAAKTDANL